MTRKYGVYLKEGWKSSKMTMKRRGSKLRFYLFTLMRLVGTLLIFTIPVFALANVEVSKQSIKRNEYNIFGSFKNATKGKIYWNTLMALLVALTAILGGVVAFGLLDFLLMLLGTAVGSLQNGGPLQPNEVGYIFTTPGSIACLVFIVIAFISFSPIAYIGDTVENIEAGNMLNRSVLAMKKGKHIVFLNFFIPFIIFSVLIGPLVPVGIFIVKTNNPLAIILFVIFTIVYCLILGIFLFPKLFLAFQNATTLFFEDSVLDEIVTENNRYFIIIYSHILFSRNIYIITNKAGTNPRYRK